MVGGGYASASEASLGRKAMPQLASTHTHSATCTTSPLLGHTCVSLPGSHARSEEVNASSSGCSLPSRRANPHTDRSHRRPSVGEPDRSKRGVVPRSSFLSCVEVKEASSTNHKAHTFVEKTSQRDYFERRSRPQPVASSPGSGRSLSTPSSGPPEQEEPRRWCTLRQLSTSLRLRRCDHSDPHTHSHSHTHTHGIHSEYTHTHTRERVRGRGKPPGSFETQEETPARPKRSTSTSELRVCVCAVRGRWLTKERAVSVLASSGHQLGWVQGARPAARFFLRRTGRNIRLMGWRTSLYQSYLERVGRQLRPVGESSTTDDDDNDDGCALCLVHSLVLGPGGLDELQAVLRTNWSAQQRQCWHHAMRSSLHMEVACVAQCCICEVWWGRRVQYTCVGSCVQDMATCVHRARDRPAAPSHSKPSGVCGSSRDGQ